MKNIIVILVFICLASILSADKSFAQDSALIHTFNTLISKVDTGFSIGINNYIDSVQIDSLNKFYFVIGVYSDTSDEDKNEYDKIYVLKYSNHQFLIIDSSSKFMYDYYTKIGFSVNKDSLFIHYQWKRNSNDYIYIFNNRLQIYQLVYFSGVYGPSFGHEYRLNSSYDVNKQLLSWEIIGVEDDNNKKFGKKKIILPQDFPIQLQKFEPEIGDYDSILIPSEWNK